MAYVPNPTDVVGTVDTTGINPGPHSTLEGVSPVFEITKPGNEIAIEDHFARQSFAAGTQEYQDSHPVGPERYTSEPFPPMNETPDTTATGGRDPSATIDRDTGPVTTTASPEAAETQGKSTSGEGSGPDGEPVQASTSQASQAGDAKPLDKRKVTELKTLADRKGIELDPDDLKADIVTKLRAEGVTDND